MFWINCIFLDLSELYEKTLCYYYSETLDIAWFTSLRYLHFRLQWGGGEGGVQVRSSGYHL